MVGKQWQTYSVNINQKYLTYNWDKYVKYSYVVKNRYHSIDYVDRNLFRTLNDPILVWIDYEHQNEYMVIPAWYFFDFGSIPTWARWICEKDEYVAFLAHDRFFDKDCEVTVIDPNNLSPTFKRLQKYWELNKDGMTTSFLYKRKFADKFMLHLIREENKNIHHIEKKLQPILVYLACRIWWATNFRKKARHY